MSTQALPTAMNDALKRAGLNTDGFRLRQACFDALARHHRNVDRALPTFEKLVAGDAVLIKEALRFYLTEHAREELSGEGHLFNDAHMSHALSRQPNGDGRDQGSPEFLARNVPASPASREWVGQPGRESHSGPARPTREPSAAQRAAAASVAKCLAVTVLDTYRVRDGRSIGDVRFGEIERMRTDDVIEASVFRQIQRKYAHAQHDAKVRELITAEELNAMKQRAAEVADAA